MVVLWLPDSAVPQAALSVSLLLRLGTSWVRQSVPYSLTCAPAGSFGNPEREKGGLCCLLFTSSTPVTALKQACTPYLWAKFLVWMTKYFCLPGTVPVYSYCFGIKNHFPSFCLKSVLVQKLNYTVGPPPCDQGISVVTTPGNDARN